MATSKTSQQQFINVSFNQIIIAVVMAMVIAGAFVAIITNMIFNSRIGALEAAFGAQHNPVNVTAADQTNNAPLCVDVSEDGEVAGASTGGEVLGASTSGAVLGYGSTKSKVMPWANYNQSNSSVITTNSTNYYTDNRWSGNSLSYTDSSTNNSNNTNTQTWNNTQAWNNGNTTNSGNTTSNTNNNNQSWNNGNTTTTSTTSNTTNTSVVISDNGNTNNQTWNQNNNSVNNSGNTATTTTNTTNISNSGNTVNDNDGIDVDL